MQHFGSETDVCWSAVRHHLFPSFHRPFIRGGQTTVLIMVGIYVHCGVSIEAPLSLQRRIHARTAASAGSVGEKSATADSSQRHSMPGIVPVVRTRDLFEGPDCAARPCPARLSVRLAASRRAPHEQSRADQQTLQSRPRNRSAPPPSG